MCPMGGGRVQFPHALDGKQPMSRRTGAGMGFPLKAALTFELFKELLGYRDNKRTVIYTHALH
jgi:hypothetical protein